MRPLKVLDGVTRTSWRGPALLLQARCCDGRKCRLHFDRQERAASLPLERESTQAGELVGYCEAILPSHVNPPDRECTCFQDRKSTRLNSSHLVISYAV